MGAVIAGMARSSGQSSCGRGLRSRWLASAVCCAMSCGAAAADEEAEPEPAAAEPVVLAQAAHAERTRPQMELSTSTLPRFSNTDGATGSSRIDMTLLPPRRSALGFAIGMSRPGTSSIAGFAPYAPAGTAVDLGLHWRYTLDSNYRLDVTAWRRAPPADAMSLIQSREPTYGARVEMRMSSATSKGLVADKGFLGFQMENGARLTVKRSRGKPMLYYRNTF
jgi:hypothetical protein